MKKITAFILPLLFIFLLFGCGKSSDSTNSTSAQQVIPEPAEISYALAENLDFNDTIELMENDERTFSQYALDGSLVQSVSRYVSSGATAEEVAVFKCNDDSSAKTVSEAVNARISELHDEYSGYAPEQVPEIDSAVVLSRGTMVIFCICSDPDDVEPVIDRIIK